MYFKNEKRSIEYENYQFKSDKKLRKFCLCAFMGLSIEEGRQ